MIKFELKHRVTGHVVTAVFMSGSAKIVDDTTVKMTLSMDGIPQDVRDRMFPGFSLGTFPVIVDVTSEGPELLTSDQIQGKAADWIVKRVYGTGHGFMDSAVAAWFAQGQ